MSNFFARFRRLLFRARTPASDESGKSSHQKTRTKSLNLPATSNSLREKHRTAASVSVKRGSQVVIRNRSQSVIVERKHVSRSVDKQSSPPAGRQTHYTIHKATTSPSGTSLAPTLTSSYRTRSASSSKPTVIYIHS